MSATGPGLAPLRTVDPPEVAAALADSLSGGQPIATLPADAAYFDIAWRMALCGSGFGLFLPPNARLIIGSAPRERAAAAGGLVGTVRLVGQTTGATLVAALLAMNVGAGMAPPLVAAGLALVAGLCSLARLRPSIRNPSSDEAEDEQPGTQVSR